MKLRMVILVSLLVLMVAGTSSAQYVVYTFQPTRELDIGLDLNWIGSGARARAMGGAFISIVDDASALTWNPAGLIQTLDPQVSFSGGYSNPNSTYGVSGMSTTDEFTSDRNVWGLSYASFLAPVRIGGHQVSASVAYQRLNEASFARLVEPGILVPEIIYNQWDSLVPAVITETVEGGLDVINLGFGTDVYQNLAFGASANIYFGSADEKMDIIADWTDMAGAGASAYEERRLFRAHSIKEVSYSGFNLTLGLHYRADRLKLALVGKTPFNLVRNFDILQADTTYNARVGYTLRQNDQLTQPLFILVDNKEKIEIPLTLAGGVSYQATPQLLLSADAEWRRFGKSNVSVLDSGLIKSSGEREEYFTDHYLQFYNSGEARVGFEYTFATSNGEFPLRGGFRYIQQYFRNVDFLVHGWSRDNNQVLSVGTYEVPSEDRVTGYALTTGGGVHWETIWLDVAYEYYTDDRTILGYDYYGQYNATDKFSQSRITVNFTGFF